MALNEKRFKEGFMAWFFWGVIEVVNRIQGAEDLAQNSHAHLHVSSWTV